MKVKAIIVDDEKMARMLLRGMIHEHLPDIEIVAECPDLSSAVKAIVKEKPDLVYLDIEMPGHSGLELLDFFEEDKINFKIIFTTAYNQYAIQAFKLSAIDYLLKPIDSKDLIQAFAIYQKNEAKDYDYRALKNNFIGDPNTHKIAISSLQSTRFINVNEISCIRADGSYSNIFLSNGQKFTASKGLKHFEETLSQYPQFMRCQKSSIINLSKITELVKSDGGSVVLDNAQSVSVSQDKLAELSERLKDFVKIP